MKIAAITITYNDAYKFNEWCSHYEEYKEDIDLNIIVDNGSKLEYLNLVKQYFKDSIIIERETNGGCTGAYNNGIRHALTDHDIDAIMLIGNDIKLKKGSISKLYKFLYSNSGFGMVAPILLGKDSEIVDDFGCTITKTLFMKPFDVGKHIKDVQKTEREVESVTGGMNLAKREFYEKVGLQDENLFMYSDEIDMAIRAKKAGFKMAVTSEVKSWHQHINPLNRQIRLPYSSYLIGRNKIYIARKHYGRTKALIQLLYHLYIFAIGFFKNIYKKHNRQDRIFFLKGTFSGFFNKMSLKDIIEYTD